MPIPTADTTRSADTQLQASTDPLAVVRFGIGLIAVSILTIAVLLALFATVVPKLMGWPTVAISSGSMEPSLHVGDVLVATPYTGKQLRPGSVVVFHDPDGAGLVSHRLESINDDKTLTMKGDANRNPDSTPIQADAVIGLGRIIIPRIGWPTLWAASGNTAALLRTGIAAMVLLYFSRWGILRRFDPWQAAQTAAHQSASSPSQADDA